MLRPFIKYSGWTMKRFNIPWPKMRRLQRVNVHRVQVLFALLMVESLAIFLRGSNSIGITSNMESGVPSRNSSNTHHLSGTTRQVRYSVIIANFFPAIAKPYKHCHSTPLHEDNQRLHRTSATRSGCAVHASKYQQTTRARTQESKNARTQERNNARTHQKANFETKRLWAHQNTNT